MKRLALQIVAVLPVAAFAQGKFEVQPFAGYRFGGTIRVADLDPFPAKIQSSLVAGASFSYNVRQFGFELVWTLQPTKGTSPTETTDLRANQCLFNVVYLLRSRDKELVPLVLFGAGFTHLRGTSSGDTRASLAVGGGIKHFFSKHMGWRLQARYTSIHLYSTPLPDVHCSPMDLYCSDEKTHDANQGDVTLGWIIQF